MSNDGTIATLATALASIAIGIQNASTRIQEKYYKMQDTLHERKIKKAAAKHKAFFEEDGTVYTLNPLDAWIDASYDYHPDYDKNAPAIDVALTNFSYLRDSNLIQDSKDASLTENDILNSMSEIPQQSNDRTTDTTEEMTRL